MTNRRQHVCRSPRKRRATRRRRGLATVEFALTASLLFVLVFAQWELCRVNMIRHSAASAAYEGARRGIVPGATVTDVETATNAILATAMARGATVTVVPDPITDTTEDVTVTVSISLDANGWVVPHFFQGNTLIKSCTLERERENSF